MILSSQIMILNSAGWCSEAKEILHIRKHNLDLDILWCLLKLLSPPNVCICIGSDRTIEFVMDFLHFPFKNLKKLSIIFTL